MNKSKSAAEGLAMVVLPKSAWEAVTEELREIKILFQKKSEEEVNNQWIESVEARKILGGGIS